MRLDDNKLTRLDCDVCGKHIGWVYEVDLTGCRFQCLDCGENDKELE